MILSLLLLQPPTAASTVPAFELVPTLYTQAVGTDPDDPAIWHNARKPEDSRILGTDKTAAPDGGLFVFDLRGRVVQHIQNLDRPNNVDVETGMWIGSGTTDIAVVSERLKSQLRIFTIDRNTGRLTDVTGDTNLFAGETGDNAAPMGVSLYRRSRDGAIFAIVSPKSGPTTNYLGQYRLQWNSATKKIDARQVRRFGNYSGTKEIESIFVDDAIGYVYYSDETVGNRKYHADPDATDAAKELAFFNTGIFQGDHEGIGVYEFGVRGGYLVFTDQIAGDSHYYFFRREGAPGNPHEHRPIAVLKGKVDDTDGIEVSSKSFGRTFPRGMLIAMNSGPKNFAIWDWRGIETKLREIERKR